jgi:hypothetical protein
VGTTYCLFKPEKKERYELWKLGLDCFPHSDNIRRVPFTIKDIYFHNTEYCLYHYIVENVGVNFALNTTLQYFHDWAEDVVKWCGQDIIEFWTETKSFNELFWEDWMKTTDDLEKTYPYTGSRFNIGKINGTSRII